jgi:hypothetical protein
LQVPEGLRSPYLLLPCPYVVHPPAHGLLSKDAAGQTRCIGDVADQQRRALKTVDAPASRPAKPVAEDKQRNGEHRHHQDVPGQDLRRDGHGTDRPGDPDHRQGDKERQAKSDSKKGGYYRVLCPETGY